MSKTKVVEIVTNDGISYGQISSPQDLMKAQEFAHQHSEMLTKDFLIGNTSEVVGLSLTLTGAMNLTIAAGRAYFDGYQFEAVETDLELDPADATHARLDYIVATIGGNNPAQIEFLPFQRIRTSQELIDGEPPYPPTQFERATEKHNVALIQVRKGTPAATPLPPTSIVETDVILYTVLVPANAEELQAENVSDARTIIANLRNLKQLQITANTNINTLQQQMVLALAYEQQVRNFTASFGRNDTLLGILNEIAAAITVLKVRYPTILSGDCRCPAYAVEDENGWVIDIPVGTAVEFGAKFVGIYAENFPESINARYVTVSADEMGFLPIVEGREDIKKEGGTPPQTGNFVRFNVLPGEKALYLKENGELEFREEITPSNSAECLLLRISPKGGAEPDIKRYLNQRNVRAHYTKIVDSEDETTTQFEWDLAIPPEIASYDIYKVDGSYRRYDTTMPTMTFDNTMEIPDVADGETWHLIIYNLAAL